VDGVETGVDVDVTRIRFSPTGYKAPDPTGSRGSRSSEIHEEAAGQASGQSRQRPIGGMAHHGQDFQRFIGTLRPKIVKGVLVEFSDIGRKQIECRVVVELATTGGTPGLLGQSVSRLLGIENFIQLLVV